MIKYRLKVQLALNDMNQKQLAEKTGIRPSTISAIYNGAVKQFPMDAMEKICAVLHCQPGDILEYLPDSPREEA